MVANVVYIPIVFCVVTLMSLVSTSAFTIRSPLSITQSWETATQEQSNLAHRNCNAQLHMSSESSSSPSLNDDEFDDDDLDEPGSMRVAEIKSELKLRSVVHSDCFDKESLVQKLTEARIAGKADPSIIDQFNKQRLEDTFNERSLDLNDKAIETAMAADGTLPGGMTPDLLKELMANPELMILLQNPKMQDAMKLMMTGGQDALEKMMKEDKEVYDVVTKLNSIMNKAI